MGVSGNIISEETEVELPGFESGLIKSISLSKTMGLILTSNGQLFAATSLEKENKKPSLFEEIKLSSHIKVRTKLTDCELAY